MIVSLNDVATRLERAIGFLSDYGHDDRRARIETEDFLHDLANDVAETCLADAADRKALAAAAKHVPAPTHAGTR